jgi:hypothetical protein
VGGCRPRAYLLNHRNSSEQNYIRNLNLFSEFILVQNRKIHFILKLNLKKAQINAFPNLKEKILKQIDFECSFKIGPFDFKLKIRLFTNNFLLKQQKLIIQQQQQQHQKDLWSSNMSIPSEFIREAFINNIRVKPAEDLTALDKSKLWPK